MKLKRKLKRTILVLSTVCLLCMAVTACASESETDTTQGTEDAQTPNSDSAQNNDADNTDDLQTPTDNADRTQTPAANADGTQIPAANADGTQMPTDDAENPQTPTDNTDDAQANNSGDSRWHVLDPETAKAVDADLEGMIHKIEQGSFFISVDETIIDEDGGITMATSSSESTVPDSELLQVIYDDNARFYIRNIYDNGASYTDEEATSGSLELRQSVSLKGTIENDIFYADEIRISIVK